MSFPAATICTVEGCNQPRRFGQTLTLCDECLRQYWRDIYWNEKAKQRKRRNKLTDQDVIQILTLRSEGYSLKQIGVCYSISWRYVSEICRRKRRQYIVS